MDWISMLADQDGMHTGEVFNDTRHHPLVMGILNVTPDSFSDGGSFSDITTACDRAVEMVADGADIIDIGGESSRPGAKPVHLKEELRRVQPVVEELSQNISIPLSIDTTKAEVARVACRSGVSIINDISALRHDSDMVSVAAESGAKVVLMHMQGTPQTMQQYPVYTDVVEEVFLFLKERIDFAVSHGIERKNIIADPGIGFGKTFHHNLSLLKNISKFHELGCQLLLGVSRKGFIGQITGETADHRGYGTASVVAYAVLNGVHIHRVHDVKEIRQVCDMLEAIGTAAWK